MTQEKQNTKYLIAAACVGAIISATITSLIMKSGPTMSDHQTTPDQKEPLYWVAPMNPDFKRGKPGKSPMGMDLVPVFEDENTAHVKGPGTLTISPEVVNNLGVRTATAQLETLKAEIKTVGYVQYDEDQLVHVHPRVEGWIEKLFVKAAGDPVKKGQPLYAIYSPELVNAQEEYIIALDRNNSRLIKAAKDRLTALRLPKDAITALKKTRTTQQTVTMFAPQEGVVDNLNIREGFFVKPGTTLMSIGILDQVWVEAEVFEREAFQITKGRPVTMTLDFLPGREWQGRVDYIYPTLDEKTRTVKVRLRFDNHDKQLKPNMFTQVIIHSHSGDKTLLVPKEAVIRTGRFDRVVLALGNGHFKSIKVKTGRSDGQNIEILSGLTAGEEIVVSAQFLLDSESSKTSDFKRMNPNSDAPMNSKSMDEPEINHDQMDHSNHNM